MYGVSCIYGSMVFVCVCGYVCMCDPTYYTRASNVVHKFALMDEEYGHRSYSKDGLYFICYMFEKVYIMYIKYIVADTLKDIYICTYISYY